MSLIPSKRNGPPATLDDMVEVVKTSFQRVLIFQTLICVENLLYVMSTTKYFFLPCFVSEEGLPAPYQLEIKRGWPCVTLGSCFQAPFYDGCPLILIYI